MFGLISLAVSLSAVAFLVTINRRVRVENATLQQRLTDERLRAATIERRLVDIEETWAEEIPVNLAPLVKVYGARLDAVEDILEAQAEERKKDLQRRAGLRPTKAKRAKR